MYKTISTQLIKKIESDSDLLNIISDENEELTVKEWVEKYRSMVSSEDILWLLLRKEFLSEKDLILFVVWCAREVLKLIENPDERNIEVCNVAERYANGEATKEELLAARDAADDAADDFDYAAANDATYAAHYAATYAVNYAADYAATYAAFYAATYAASTISHTANDAAARASQIDQLLTYFE
jgi:hypothetical protein